MFIRQRVLLVSASRSYRFLLNSTQYNTRYATNTKLLSACQYTTMPLYRWLNYIIYTESNDAFINKYMSQKYSTDTNQIAIPIVTYEEVKDLPNHPDKWLIDVREPKELKETGVIPTAINIPRKYLIFFFFLVNE